MRAKGTGSVTPHRGGHWARMWDGGKLKSLGVHATPEIADTVLALAHEEQAKRAGACGSSLTFAAFGLEVLDMREADDVRAIASERRRFATHLATSEIADKDVRDVTPADVADLQRALGRKFAQDKRAKRKLSRKTVQRVMSLASAIFDAAVSEKKLRPDNPCAGIKVRRDKDESVDEDGDTVWDWLRGEEQQAFLACEAVPMWLKLMARFAWGTGLRQGEQWNLEVRDVHWILNVDTCACGVTKCIQLKEKGAHVFVRWGAKGKRPKNGKTRRVTLFGEGLAAAKAWRELGYAKSNPLGLMFPTLTGCRRQPGAPQRTTYDKVTKKVGKAFLLPEALAAAGIHRNIRWHDLRHTCASSLVSGTWGISWPLIKVRDVLGHSSVKVTEKYAHLGTDALQEHADQTAAWGTDGVTDGVTGRGPGADSEAAISNDFNESGSSGTRTRDLRIKRGHLHVSKTGLYDRAEHPRNTNVNAAKILELVAAGRGREALALAVTDALGATGDLVDQEARTA